MPFLTPYDTALLSTASPVAITTSARRTLTNINRRRWLADRNRYRTATVQSIGRDVAGSRLSSYDLAAYIAVSAPLHCCDGWAFLGRAIGCHLHGDSDSARHLAYYAELRATMALLATQGIGIFNSRHYVIDGTGTAQPLNWNPTHEAAWHILEWWANSPPAATLISHVLQPGGSPLSQWIAALPTGGSWRPIATDWLLKLGLDLQQLSRDRAARNEASYRPTRLNERRLQTSVEAAVSIAEMWRLLEPASSMSFGEIDRFLLRLTFETAFWATTRRSRLQAPRMFDHAITAMVAANVSGPEASLWEEFLRRDREPLDPRILDLVRLTSRNSAAVEASRAVAEPDQHLSVMARSLLLLRFASGAARQMLVDAGISFDALSFWWNAYGTDRGLWATPPAAAEITDGWANTEAGLVDLDDWIARTSGGTYYELLSDVPSVLATLTNMEMVGLWSIAS